MVKILEHYPRIHQTFNLVTILRGRSYEAEPRSPT
jgi:hypothetical protein